jgi:hypothetical protein
MSAQRQQEAALGIPHAVDRKPHGRSRLSNNAEALSGVDMRTVIGRRYKDLVRAIISDQGGVDRLAEARIQLIRRFAGIGCLAEAAEARMALGQPFDVNEYIQLASTMARIAGRIGINRTAKDAISLKEYVTAPAKPPPVEIEAGTVETDADNWDGIEP